MLTVTFHEVEVKEVRVAKLMEYLYSFTFLPLLNFKIFVNSLIPFS